MTKKEQLEHRSNIKLLLEGTGVPEDGPPEKLPDARTRNQQLPCPQHQPLQFNEPDNKAGDNKARETVLGSAR